MILGLPSDSLEGRRVRAAIQDRLDTLLEQLVIEKDDVKLRRLQGAIMELKRLMADDKAI